MYYKNLIFTAAFSFVVSLTCLAQSFVSAHNEEAALAVTYNSSDDEVVVINVAYDNPDGSSFQLLIINGNGETLYRNTYTNKTLQKKFRIPKEHSKLTVRINDVVDGSFKRVTSVAQQQVVTGISF